MKRLLVLAVITTVAIYSPTSTELALQSLELGYTKVTDAVAVAQPGD